jgi:cyanate permease
VLKKIFGVLDFSLFRSPLFRLLCLYFVTSPMIYIVPVYLPAMAKERGLDEDQRALLLR